MFCTMIYYAVLYQIFNYISCIDLFYNNQYALRSGHSKLLPLLIFIQYINIIHSNNDFIATIFIDI